MVWLFFILWLLSCAALIVGLIRPRWVIPWGSKKTRLRVGAYYVPAIILSFFFIGVTAPPSATSGTGKSSSASVASAHASTRPTPVSTNQTAVTKASPSPQEHPAAKKHHWWEFWASDSTPKQATKTKSSDKPASQQHHWWEFWTSHSTPKQATKTESSDQPASQQHHWWEFWKSDTSTQNATATSNKKPAAQNKTSADHAPAAQNKASANNGTGQSSDLANLNQTVSFQNGAGLNFSQWRVSQTQPDANLDANETGYSIIINFHVTNTGTAETSVDSNDFVIRKTGSNSVKCNGFAATSQPQTVLPGDSTDITLQAWPQQSASGINPTGYTVYYVDSEGQMVALYKVANWSRSN